MQALTKITRFPSVREILEKTGFIDGLQLLIGSKNEDTLVADDRPSVLFGGGGNDGLFGGAADDVIIADNRPNEIVLERVPEIGNALGVAGDDIIWGGAGNDLIQAGNGNDIVDGGVGNDLIQGGAGDDVIDGGQGSDILRGGSGSDRIHLGDGDIARGGNGDDTFIVEASFGKIIIGDFKKGDKLVIKNPPEDFTGFFIEDGFITIRNGGLSIVLQGVTDTRDIDVTFGSLVVDKTDLVGRAAATDTFKFFKAADVAEASPNFDNTFFNNASDVGESAIPDAYHPHDDALLSLIVYDNPDYGLEF